MAALNLKRFLQNAPAARANPGATPRDRARAVVDAQREMLRKGRLVSDLIEPARRRRAADLADLYARLGPFGKADLREEWERLGAQDVIPARWLDGTAQFVDGVLGCRDRLEEANTSWVMATATPEPTSRRAVWALAMAGEEAATIEALWREAHSRLCAVLPLPPFAAPRWSAQHWMDPSVGHVHGYAGVTVWLPYALAFYTVTNGAGVARSGDILTRLRAVANELTFPLPDEKDLALTPPGWQSAFGHVARASIAWEMACELGFALSHHPDRPIRPECADQPFSRYANPYAPLVEITRRGYGWARCAITDPATETRELGVALIAPVTSHLDENSLTPKAWFPVSGDEL